MYAALVALGALTLGCGKARPPSLLLIVSDAFRADEIRCDAPEPLTPHLCALAHDGVWFERAYSSSPWTVPSTIGLLTGHHPGAYRMSDWGPDASHWYHVPESEEVLAERLAARGYKVRSYVGAGIVETANALQGFTPFTRAARGVELRRADTVQRLALDVSIHRNQQLLPALSFLLDPPDASYFALCWIRDPHALYAPPRKHRDRVEVPDDLPRSRDYYLGLGHRDRPDAHPPQRKLRSVGAGLEPVEVAFLRDLYRAEVRSVDERVGYLMRALELSGRRSDTLVVFTSDHGEAFGEHGKFLHSAHHYEELVSIPVILAGPGIPKGRVVRESVAHVDLVPTLESLLGLDSKEGADGRSFADLLRGDARSDEAAHYLAEPQRNTERYALVKGHFKLIRKPDLDVEELYNVVDDPEERRDLLAEKPEVAERLRRHLVRIRDAVARRREENLEKAPSGDEALGLQEATEAQLRAIGYID
jgi:arylsulfatase A-like enzyme